MKDLFKTSKGKYVAPAPIEDRLVANPAVEACCVVGANYPQPFALLMLNEDAVAKSRDAAGRAALEDAMANHLMTVNHGLDPHEQLEVLILMTEPWTVENGLITPTFKVKRNVLETRYDGAVRRAGRRAAARSSGPPERRRRAHEKAARRAASSRRGRRRSERRFLVQRQRQELGEGLVGAHLLEDLRRAVELADGRRRLDLGELLGHQRAHHRRRSPCGRRRARPSGCGSIARPASG